MQPSRCVVLSTDMTICSCDMYITVIECIQVYGRLQKMMLCLSHQATLKMLDVVAEGHDELVWEWRESLLDRIEFTDIPVCFIYKPMHLQD